MRRELKDALAREGLYADEAEGLLNTWEVSYFKRPGTRVFFMVPPIEVERVVSKLRTQKGIVIDYDVVEGASHFWMENLPDVEQRVGAYLDKRLAAEPA